jgi:hypothetical protein
VDGETTALGKFLGAKETHRPSGQHEMDSRYLERVEALTDEPGSALVERIPSHRAAAPRTVGGQ